RCQARAIIPRIASGRSQTIWPPSGSVKRRNGLAVPVSKSPPGPPAPPGCCRRVPFLAVVDPPFPFPKGKPGGVPLAPVDEVPPVFVEPLVALVEGGGLLPNPP